MKKIILLVLLLFINPTIFSQEANSSSSFYSSFDKIIGKSNTNLTYGIIFKEKYRKLKNNHNYYFTNRFLTGSVTYRNETFYKVDLKYDLAEDLLIINILNNEEKSVIILEKELITNFQINNQKFINTKEVGFLQEIFSSKDFSVYKKHRKRKKERLSEKFIYHTFKKEEKTILFYNNKYNLIKSKRDFIKLFPKKKKKILKFYKINKFLSEDKFIPNLMKSLLIKSKKE